LSSLDDGSHVPSRTEVDDSLGSSARLWARLVAGVAKVHAPIEQAWTFSGPKYGWSLRLKRKDRVVLYLIPQLGHFLVGVVLGGKAVLAAREADLPASVLEAIDGARPYAEGRGIRVPVRDVEDVRAAMKLAALKMAR
jgi:hypothetical protein